MNAEALRTERNVAVAVAVVVALVGGWLYLDARSDRDAAQEAALSAETELEEERTNPEVERLRAELEELTDVLMGVGWDPDLDELDLPTQIEEAERQERFRYMSAACARLVNYYIDKGNYLDMLMMRYYETGVSAAVLQDDLYGLGRYMSDFAVSLPHDRAGCGMREKNSKNPLYTPFVTPVPRDWREGVEPPLFP